MSEQMIKVTAEDGHTYDAFRVTPEGGVKGGLVILQEIFGMTDQLKGATRYWAEHGYDTILPAMYDRIKPQTIVPFDDMENAQGMMKQASPEGVEMDIRAAVAAVNGDKGVSLMGFCWGGGLAVRMASVLDLKGIVSYYGTMLDQNSKNGANCASLFHFGATDEHWPPEIFNDVKKVIPDAEHYIYDAGHAFANDHRPSHYDEAATKLAHERSLKFLDRVHGA